MMGDWGIFVALLAFYAGLFLGPRVAAFRARCEAQNAAIERDLKGVRWATRSELGAPSCN